jgi:hypothetical protein
MLPYIGLADGKPQSWLAEKDNALDVRLIMLPLQYYVSICLATSA